MTSKVFHLEKILKILSTW